jgi:hypothetical protein
MWLVKIEFKPKGVNEPWKVLDLKTFESYGEASDYYIDKFPCGTGYRYRITFEEEL